MFTARVIALIDGFNFYHPIKEAQKQQQRCLQWLNYRSLLNRYIIERPIKSQNGVLTDIYFFTALAYHLDQQFPETTKRHNIYIDALKTENIHIIQGKFKQKKLQFNYRCKQAISLESCTIDRISHIEKETDVRIACKLLELAFNDAFDTCLLLSADSDLIPAIETMKQLFPEKKIILVTPPNAHNIDELKTLSDAHIKVKIKHLENNQFPQEMVSKENYPLTNPWANIFTTSAAS